MRKLDGLMRKVMELQSAQGKEKSNEAQIIELEEQMRKIVGFEKSAQGKGKSDKEQMRKTMQAQMPRSWKPA